jgi:hypothetical protein
MPNTYLVHHGIKGQRWGVRRFQNNDGTLTAAGTKRYGVAGTNSAKYQKDLAKDQKRNSPEYRRKMKKIKIGAAIAGGVLAEIGTFAAASTVMSRLFDKMNHVPSEQEIQKWYEDWYAGAAKYNPDFANMQIKR